MFDASAQGQTADIRGIVRSANGDPLGGVTVHVVHSYFITQTNKDGEYSFEGVPTNISLRFSRLGYKTITLDLGLLPATENEQDVLMIGEIKSLDEISITEKFSGNNFNAIEAQQLKPFPNVSGSFEGFLKNMPGVSVNNELSSQYSVRGGTFDENLVYVNEVEIFRPLLISRGQQEGLGIINPDLAGSVRFSAGGFEARYGDRLSSVLDVRYARPDTFSLQATAGILGSSATVKLPLRNSYLLAGVRNKRNHDLLVRQNLSGKYEAAFSDYQALYKADLSSRLSASIFGNYGRGRLNVIPGERNTEFGTSDEVLQLLVNYAGYESSEYSSATTAFTLQYNVSSRLNLKWISSISVLDEKEEADLLGWYRFDERDGGLGPGKANVLLGRGSQYDYAENKLYSRIWNSEFRAYSQLNRSFLEFGLKFQQDRVEDSLDEYYAVDSTGFSLPAEGSGWLTSDVVTQSNSIGIGRVMGYLQNTFTLNPFTTFVAGVRTNYNSFTREVLFSPRASIIHYPAQRNDLLLRLSGGWYHQPPFYRELRTYQGRLNAHARAQRSLQLVAGADYSFEGLGTRLSMRTEAYYKHFDRLTPYRNEDLRLRYFSDQQSKGYAVGADVILSGNFARDLESTFRVSLLKSGENIDSDSYSVSDSLGNTTLVYPGYIRRPQDQRINLSMLFQDRLLSNPTYKVHLNLFYASALPTGPPGAPRYADVFKIPAYKRVDIGFSKDFADREGPRVHPFIRRYFQELSAHIEIFNLLNFKNTASFLWLNDARDISYAVPNYLTFRKFNFRVSAVLKWRD